MVDNPNNWTGLASALANGDRYTPLQCLGKKAGRQTWLCQDSKTGQRVVIKLLNFGEEFSWDDLKLFEREAETLRSLDHPAIPQYLDYFELETSTTKGFALVQSYIEAQSLEAQLLAGRSFSEAEIQQIGEDLLQILDYLHGRQPAVIHRDIKPSNILLSDRSAHSAGQVYLVDFGSVQTLAAREGSTITVVGTYGYMPPEQFGGRAVPASDLYSLGATLIYLASGRHPAEFPQKDLRIQFTDQVQLTPQAIAWLQLLTEPSLERRAASAQQANLSRIRPQPQAPQSRSSGQAVAALALQPSFSKIEARYEPQAGLKLTLPSGQFMLGTIESSSWKSGCGALVLVMASLGAGIWGIVTISALIAWAVVAHTTFTLLGVLVACLALAGGVFYLAPRFSKQVTLVIDQQTIQIQRRGCKARIFNRHHAWKLARSPRLTLFIGTHELGFSGYNEELLWLEQVLRDELGLPSEEA